jgi:hypothetical protein
MRRAVFKLVGAVAAIGMAGGVAVYTAAPGGGEEEAVSQVATPTTSATAAGLISFADLPKCPPVKGLLCDPTAGLSDSERDALYQRTWNEFEVSYTAWLAALDVSKLDLRSLPRYELNTEWAPGQPTLRDAVARADMIVVGNVTGFNPKTFSTTLSVDKTLKGAPVFTVELAQGGHLSPTEDWTGVTISEEGNRALLLPGDRAILLLQQDGKGGYYIQGVSGWFQVVDGLMRANYYNDWRRASVDGETEAAFVQQLSAALQPSPPTP